MAGRDTIAVLGAGGTMGFAMARNLARAGFAMRAWNRSRERAEPLREDGALIFDSPAEAIEGADLILTMLPDADAVQEVMRSALASAQARGVIWLQMSTIGESGTDSCVVLAREHELELIDAPVLGTKQPALEGKLVVFASGPVGLRERVAAAFDAVAARTMWVGDAGAGTRLKLATNSWLLAVIEGAAETLALAEGLGLDPQLVLDALVGGPLYMPYLQTKAKAIMGREFAPSFRLSLAAKDAALIEEAALRHGLDLPLVHTIRERLQQGAAEHGDEDLSATYLTSAAAG